MDRSNNFDWLRLLFAAIVVLLHCDDLSQSNSLRWLPMFLNRQVAIDGFFAMSGFLIVGSYERSSSLMSYLGKRVRRIAPAYWAALAESLVLGASLSTLPLAQFAKSHETWKYIFADLTFANFLHPWLPGVFSHNADNAVNGALWTIKIEIMFYLLVPVLIPLCRRFGRWQTLSTLITLSIIYFEVCQRLHHPTLAKQLPGQLSFFLAGTIFYYYSPFFMQHKLWMWGVALFAAIGFILWGGLGLELISVCVATFCFAFLVPHIAGATRFGDLSYGIYVFHFPIIQTLIALGFFRNYPIQATAIVAVSVTLLAMASWRWVESPSLKSRPSGQSGSTKAATGPDEAIILSSGTSASRTRSY